MSPIDFIKMSLIVVYNTYLKRCVFILKKDKQKALELIKQKNNCEIIITYKEISDRTDMNRGNLLDFPNKLKKGILMI